MKLNNKGASYVGLIVSLVLLLSIVSITGSFMVYVRTHRKEAISQTETSQIVLAKISEVYLADWDTLADETITGDHGEIKVSYGELEETEYATNSLDVTFEKDGEEVTYELERSVYHVE